MNHDANGDFLYKFNLCLRSLYIVMANMVPKSESDRHATQKEAKCSSISIQNHTFEVAIVIVMLSWKFTLYSAKKEASYRKNDCKFSLSIPFSF